MTSDGESTPVRDAEHWEAEHRELDRLAGALRHGALSALLIADLRAGRPPTAQTLIDLKVSADHLYLAVVAAGDPHGELERKLARTGATEDLLVVHAVIDQLVFALVPGAVAGPAGAGTVARSSRQPLARAATAFAEAEHALRTAQRFGVTGLVDLPRLGPLPIVTATAEMAAKASAERFAQLDALGPAGAEIEAAVAALLAHDLSIDATAATLGLHRNTVRARRERFRELTGLDIARTSDLVTAWWLLGWRRADRA